MLIKTPLLHQSFGPGVFLSIPSFCLSVCLSLSFWLIPWSAEARWAHFLAWASKTLSRRRTAPSPTREGAWCLRAAAPALRTLLALHLNQGTSASFSYFLIVNSRPPGSGPLKDQHWTDLFIFLFNPTILCFYLVNGGEEERYLKKKKKKNLFWDKRKLPSHSACFLCAFPLSHVLCVFIHQVPPMLPTTRCSR